MDLRTALTAVGMSILITLLINSMVLEIDRVGSESMSSSLDPDTFVMVNKLATQSGAVEVGDLVVFPDPDGTGLTFVKRVIALGGAVIETKDGVLYVDESQYGDPGPCSPGYVIKPLTVETGHAYLAGDNMNLGPDQVAWHGQVAVENIEGKVSLILWPLGKSGPVVHGEMVCGSSL